jgi:uncharacterized membrane protein
MNIKRTFFKTVTYRIFGSALSFSGTLIISNDLKVSSCVAAVDFLAKPILYFLHEAIWDKINLK